MQYFKLFNSCRVVKGAENSLIYDLERMDNSNSIPSSIYEVLIEHIDKSIEEVKSAYENKYDETIDEYFEFLIKNEYIFYCTKEELELFPTIDFKWKSPKKITNSIIDYDGTITISAYKKIIKELSVLGCEAVQIRSFISLRFEELKEFLVLFEETSITSIELVFRFNAELSDDEIIELQKQYPRIRKVDIYSSPKNASNYIITHTQYDVNSTHNKEEDEKKFLSIGFETFSEAQHHNIYFNRKIYISSEGKIKNAPECEEEFGYIQDLRSIEELNIIISLPEFRKYWFVSPDMIDVTKDSEFRYAVLDIRIPCQRKDDSWYYKEEPNYNPYISKWKGEDGYLSLKECGVIVNEKGSKIDEVMVAEINEQLWKD